MITDKCRERSDDDISNDGDNSKIMTYNGIIPIPTSLLISFHWMVF